MQIRRRSHDVATSGNDDNSTLSISNLLKFSSSRSVGWYAQYVSEGKSVFSEDEARVVFGNVALLTNYNKALLKDLRGRVQVPKMFIFAFMFVFSLCVQKKT